MRRNSYTEDEVKLCTYAALYDEIEFGSVDTIHELTGRSKSSIKMKIQNIAAILDEEGIKRNKRVSALSGMPPGADGRRTNWVTIEPLTRLTRDDFRSMCRKIVDNI
jgi:hypothetical protein